MFRPPIDLGWEGKRAYSKYGLPKSIVWPERVDVT